MNDKTLILVKKVRVLFVCTYILINFALERKTK